jgi:4-aminobutyrate aminotransferase-like enzyme
MSPDARTPLRPPARGDIERTRHGIGTVTGGEGAYAIDAAGRRYIDAMSNRSQLGYSYGDELAAAARAGEVPGAEPLPALRARLVELAPGTSTRSSSPPGRSSRSR